MVDPFDFVELFQGNPSAYGLVHGESIKEPLTLNVWDEHLHGAVPIGVYPLVEFTDVDRQQWATDHDGMDGGKFYVHWGCTDIDNKEDPEACWPLALNMEKALAALGITTHVERTKGKGYHVWVFADEWIPAIVMRRALLAAHQIAGVAPVEVNPKQVEAKGVGLGNYVNLPYPNGAVDKRVMVSTFDREPYKLDEFLTWALEHRTSFDVLKAAALLYREPPKRHVGAYTEPDATATALTWKLPGLAYTIWKDGKLEGRDRSGMLARFCHLCAESRQVSPGECLVMLRDLDSRHGKYFDRADCDTILAKLVDHAYSKPR